MPVGEFCNCEVVIADLTTPVLEAASLMRQYHVGNVVVVDEVDGMRVPIGIVTDRDIVIEVVANGLDPATITVGEIMGDRLVTAHADEGLFETMQLMRRKGVRRVPVVDERGALAGILALDDVVALLAEEMNEVAQIIAREQVREAEART